jgi:hypothetical protein
LGYGEFSLHKDYFSGLYQVKAGIGNSPKIASTLASARKIMQLYQRSSTLLRQNTTINKDQRNFLQNTWKALLKQVSEALSELQEVTLSSEVSITDKGRMDRLDQQCRLLQDCEGFAIELSYLVKGVNDNDRLKQAEINVLKGFYDK